MKIVIATAVYHPMINGVAVFSHHLAIGLARRGHQVLVLCPSQTGQPHTHNQRFQPSGKLTTVYLKSTQFKFYPDQIHATTPKKRLFGQELPHFFYRHGFRVSLFPKTATQHTLDRFRPDVVHIQVADPIGLATADYAKKHHIPIVTTEHNQPEVLTNPLGIPKFLKPPLESFLSRYFMRRQNQGDFATMPTKEAVKNLIVASGKDFKVPVAAISNGVDLTNFHPGTPAKALYQKYHLPQNTPVVLYVGRVDPEKKVNLLIKAFAKVYAQLPEAHLVIIGDGVALPSLKTTASQLDAAPNIHFLGRVTPPDLYDLYQIGHVFATMSEIETEGIVLIEAAATGLPLVAVKKGAVSAVCQDQINGYLCPPGDITTVASSIHKILVSPKLQSKFQQNSLKIAQQHDFAHTLDQFENIYRHVTKNHPNSEHQ